MGNMNRSRTKPAAEKSGKEQAPEGKSTRGKNIPVTFTVTVPDTTGDQTVYLAGNFQQFDKKLPDWDPHGLEMTRLSPNQWSITIMGKPKTEIEYKYTLGGWDRVEVDAQGGETMNRHAALVNATLQGLNIDDTVQAWR